ncbi:MAG: thioredoxin-disulfide reductase [Clostridiales bacterium]|jgi:thioredoxin reductase (NADPH)|nr:thioredoxin-disulfide reductase [Clostridiales bacterium]
MFNGMTAMRLDVAVIGAGPAGLSAGLYASRANLKTIVFEKGVPGGQVVITDAIANYPGAGADAGGQSLVARMVEQAESFGAKILTDPVEAVDLSGRLKSITTPKGVYEARAVIIATGGKPKVIGCPGEAELTGKGVSYCATCDAAFFKDLEVFVIGGGDAAVEEALYLTKFARKVTIVHRRNELRAAKHITEKAFQNPRLEFMWDTVVQEIKGEDVVEAVILKNLKTGTITERRAREEDGLLGVFPFIGFDPVSGLFKDAVAADEQGYIITDDCMRTNIDGVFAAGDIRRKPLRQVVTAASDGAVAAVCAEKYIEANKW